MIIKIFKICIFLLICVGTLKNVIRAIVISANSKGYRIDDDILKEMEHHRFIISVLLSILYGFYQFGY